MSAQSGSHRSATAWGRWGPEDERGALNLLTPDRVAAAARGVRAGAVYPLGLPIQRTGVPIYDYRGAPYRLTLTNEHDAHRWESAGAPAGTGANADLLVSATHNGTHMDALCHVFAEGKLYNGFPSSSFTPSDGAARCGIDKVGGLVGRAVVLDVAGATGVRCLEPGEAVTAEMIERAEAHHGVTVEAGDIVLLHTGWLRHFLEQAEAGVPVSLDRQPGLGRSGAGLLIDRDVSAVGADNTAVEVLGAEAGFIELHVELIVHRGIPLLELLDLRGPVEAGVATGMLVVAPLVIAGGSGSPVNPVLIT
ncbi:cyclase family protein [Nocardia aobensis]|uniref:Cyclase family protein n=1 Tax=Nocardia aobensis TaxID=257277 RepID=A0ABW6P9I6_9NOCA